MQTILHCAQGASYEHNRRLACCISSDMIEMQQKRSLISPENVVIADLDARPRVGTDNAIASDWNDDDVITRAQNQSFFEDTLSCSGTRICSCGGRTTGRAYAWSRLRRPERDDLRVLSVARHLVEPYGSRIDLL